VSGIHRSVRRIITPVVVVASSAEECTEVYLAMLDETLKMAVQKTLPITRIAQGAVAGVDEAVVVVDLHARPANHAPSGPARACQTVNTQHQALPRQRWIRVTSLLCPKEPRGWRRNLSLRRSRLMSHLQLRLHLPSHQRPWKN
jgi:hypothetical protein